MKVSVVVTVLNEAETILALLFGLFSQTLPANEVIIVDAGSTDGTIQLIEVFTKQYPQFPLDLLNKKGNRSVGRNFGIKNANHDWIAITDAGCVPHVDWLEELTIKANETKADVIAGYYDASPETAFQQAIVPYMLVMPDRVNHDHFLPATRSMMMKKQSWKKVGGFDEDLTLSEDYDFAHKLEKAKFKLTFTDLAKVSWWPIENLRDFYQTVRDMAQHDAQAGLTRLKAYLVISRYLIFMILLFVFCCVHWSLGLGFIIGSTAIYAFWAIWKNAQYLDGSWIFLPILQIVADFGVMVGTVRALNK